MKYVVKIHEVLCRYVTVEANSAGEAVDKVWDAHQRGDISLDYDDYDGADVSYVREADSWDVERFEAVEANK